MDRQPVLKGERLVLRPLEEADRAAFLAVASDPLIWEQHPDPGRWREPACNAWFDGGLAEGGALAAVDRADGRLVGSSRYQSFDVGPDAAVIGSTFLARSHWGGPWNREMKQLMLAHALAALPRAVFLVGEANHRSRRALDKIGARLTDQTFVAELASGAVLHLIYEITRESFAEGPLAHA
jgi:RimJ/RimL family protein N-acetyltransferase